ncbi:hypothetical protein, partial [Streptococcus ferus]|uniref:hypothetical protein n=1 Tax=Streptococcus ferus TaxID=1345 RepID=UPI00359F4445
RWQVSVSFLLGQQFIKSNVSRKPMPGIGFFIVLTNILLFLTIIIVKMKMKCYNILGNNDKGEREDYGKAF